MLLVAVPGHHLFNNFQTSPKSVSFRFIPKLWSAEICFTDETGHGDWSGVLSTPPQLGER